MLKARYVPVGRATRMAIDAQDQQEARKAVVRMKADVIGALAGPLASAKHLRQSSVFMLMTSGHRDNKIALDKVDDFADTTSERNTLLNELHERAAFVVRAEWTLISTLADALLLKPRMDAVEIAANIEMAGGAPLMNLSCILRLAIEAAKSERLPKR